MQLKPPLSSVRGIIEFEIDEQFSQMWTAGVAEPGKANGSASHSSRRRRRGGRSIAGRGGGRSSLWEEGRDSPSTKLSARGTSGGGALTKAASDGKQHVSQSSSGTERTSSPGASGRQGTVAVSSRGVHPAMLESEFLASTRQADGDGSGVASLSLEEVPYDRDLRWCNLSSDSRPRPTMDTATGVFGRVGAAITQDTAEYERLDRHYQELWKDREGNGPPAGRGRGGRASRGGRSRARGASGGGGGGQSTAGPRSSAGSGPVRGEASNGTGPRKERHSNGRTGDRTNTGDGRNSSGKGGGSAQRTVSTPARANGFTPTGMNGPRQGQGGDVGRGTMGGGATRARGGPRSAATSRAVQQQQGRNGPGFRAQGPTPPPPAAGAAAAFAAAAATSMAARQARGGGSPAQILDSDRQLWDSQSRHQLRGQAGSAYPSPPGRSPWAVEQRLAPSPTGPVGFPRRAESLPLMGTTALAPPLPLHLGGLPSDSPEYLGDLANALKAPSVSPPPHGSPGIGSLSAAQATLADSPLLGGSSTGAARDGVSMAGGGGGEGITAAHNGGAALSPYVSPQRFKHTHADLSALADPSLAVDIQDICADLDLNADAPAFVPGGHFSL